MPEFQGLKENLFDVGDEFSSSHLNSKTLPNMLLVHYMADKKCLLNHNGNKFLPFLFLFFKDGFRAKKDPYF